MLQNGIHSSHFYFFYILYYLNTLFLSCLFTLLYSGLINDYSAFHQISPTSFFKIHSMRKLTFLFLPLSHILYIENTQTLSLLTLSLLTLPPSSTLPSNLGINSFPFLQLSSLLQLALVSTYLQILFLPAFNFLNLDKISTSLSPLISPLLLNLSYQAILTNLSTTFPIQSLI